MYHNPSASTYTHTPSPTSTPTSLITAFHASLPSYAPTPLHSLPTLASTLSLSSLHLKDESSRLTLPAFKILGASWAIQRALCSRCALPLTTPLADLGLAARKRGTRLVACTEGNWGRAVAKMGGYLRVATTVVVPAHMDAGTRERIAGEGAEVVVVEGDYDGAVEVARREGGKENVLLVMDTSWEGYEEIPQWVVEGYTTLLAETTSQLSALSLPPATHVIASVGVGSWAQAVVQHYKSTPPPLSTSSSTTAISPAPQILTVEPLTAPSLHTSLLRSPQTLTPIRTTPTIMCGLNCGTVSHTAWPVLRDGVDAALTVSDAEVHRDVLYLQSQGLDIGPCGAATLSAVRRVCGDAGMRERLGIGGESVVVVFGTEG
ncbi:tryptophan synthase beta subunit-like PLP-dependent enzyme, partial [Massariosphaeria phaeospora]